MNLNIDKILNKTPSKALGLAIGQRSILVAEVQVRGGQRAVLHVAEFVYPEGVTLATPDPLGKALGQFLRSERIGARDAIIGLPAKRLVTRKKDVPPATPVVAASTLRLQAEGEFSSEHGGLAIDFAGETSTTEATSVLLVATARDCIDQCSTLARAAGLRLRGITATATALGRFTTGVPNGDGVVVSVAPGNSELIAQHGAQPTQLRHLNVNEVDSPESLSILTGEIRRTVAALPRNGSPMTLAVWDRAGDRSRIGGQLQERLNMPVTAPDLTGVAASAGSGLDARSFAPAIAVALAGMNTSRPAIDFLHSRLAPPKARSNKRAMGWAIAIGAALLIAAVSAVIDMNQQEAQLSDMTNRAKAMADDVQRARTAADRLRTARAWNSGNPRFVACLRDLTTLFPDEGTVYVTSLTLQNDGTGRLTGKAANQQQALALADKIGAAKFFTKPQLEMHESDRSDRETTFIITFAYHGTE